MIKLTKYQQTKVDESVFNELTPEACYWIGFITADGCLTTKNSKKYLQLKLQSGDESHIDKFQKFTKYTGNVQYEYATNAAKLTIRTDGLYNKLIECGLCERKSYNDFKIIDELANNRDFWRGLIDGDGHINIRNHTNYRYKYPVIVLLGRLPILMQFQEYIKKSFKYTPKIYHKSDNFSKIDIQAGIAKQIIELLYKDSVVYLDRKYDKAMEIIHGIVYV